MSKLCALFLVALLLASAASSQDLALHLETDTPAFASSESVELSVRLSALRDDFWWIMIPRMEAAAQGLAGWPMPILSFEIRDAQGVPLEKLPWRPDHLAAPPQISEFVEMHGREFFGRRVSLTTGPWAFRFPGPGRYRVTARLQCTARDWLERITGSGTVKAKQIAFPLDRLYQGELVSNSIEVEIR